MIAAESPDLVSVSPAQRGPLRSHLEVIEAGVPLLAEKPLVFDLGQADQMIAAAAERDLFFAINFNHRYAEPVRRAKAAISGGDLGDLVFASWRFGGELRNDRHPHANLIETQCHGLDMLEYLCGPIGSVMAQMTNSDGGVYPTLAVSVAFASGAVGSLLGSYETSYAYPGHALPRSERNGGRLLIEDTVKRFTLSRAGDETRQVWEAGYFNDAGREFHHTFDKHADALLAALTAGTRRRRSTPAPGDGHWKWPARSSRRSARASACPWQARDDRRRSLDDCQRRRPAWPPPAGRDLGIHPRRPRGRGASRPSPARRSRFPGCGKPRGTWTWTASPGTGGSSPSTTRPDGGRSGSGRSWTTPRCT